ncbi:MAG TPA: NHLP bacteriocin export ABC transporter permease/ATPase subunit, partial [Elusimicrobiota bacterium]|nr:NHLP bacteriocin export ABC transporter permease/ATPase subunit [Elusimicrobiota bacterium]
MADAREPAGGGPIALDDPGAVWVVEEGSVDVFAARLEEGRPSGRRTFLFTAAAGEALFGAASADGWGLVGLGALGSRARRLSEGEALNAGLSDAYLEKVRGALAPDPDDRAERVLPLPAQEPPGAPEEEHAFLWKRLLSELNAAAGREEGRRRLRADLDREMYQKALHDLASVIAAPEALGASAGAAGEDRLSRACADVGAAADIRFTAPPKAPEGLPLRHRVDALCNASRVRSRRVALRGRWWTADGGPILAFRGKAGDPDSSLEPVALVPSSATSYVLRDPEAGTSVPVGEAEAAGLHPFGHVFYKPLPDGKVKVSDIFSFIRRDMAADAGTVAALAVAGAVLSLAVPLVTGKLFDTVIPNSEVGTLVQFTLGLVAAGLATAVFGITQGIGLLRVESKWGSSLQAASWDRLLRLPPPFFRRYSVGDLALRANAINSIRDLLSGSVMSSAMASLQGAFNLFLLFTYGPRLAAAALVLLAAVIGVQSLLLWLSLRRRYAQADLDGRLSGLVLQLLDGVSKLRVGAAERRAFAVWSRRYAQSAQNSTAIERYEALSSVFNVAVPVVASMALYWVVNGSLYPDPGTAPSAPISVGDFMAFTAAFTTFLSAGTSLSGTAFSLLDIAPLWERAKPIFEETPENDGAKPHPGTLRGRIDAHHLTFRYKADGPKVLDDVSFHVEPGEFLAVVGPSGSGKSTLMRLLLGFESPEVGAIYYDGKDAAKHDIVAIRRQIGAVLQSARLISGDIYTNIVGGLPLSLDDAWAAAEAAGVADEIRAMPMGMQTVIGEGASTLSGGQRQRLIIARALARKPRLVLFDEATSALDNRTQTTVTKSLESLKVTRLVIAHRLTTIRNADRI